MLGCPPLQDPNLTRGGAKKLLLRLNRGLVLSGEGLWGLEPAQLCTRLFATYFCHFFQDLNDLVRQVSSQGPSVGPDTVAPSSGDGSAGLNQHIYHFSPPRGAVQLPFKQNLLLQVPF